jgi:hypothetical protein
MPEVCASNNLKITSGVLGLPKWSAPRMVQQVNLTSTGDGTISSAGLTTQPGRLMLDGSCTFTSDSPIPMMMRFQVIRAYRTLICSSPNAVQIWDSWNYAIDGTPDVPDTYNLVNSLTTLGIDVGTDTNAQPYSGRIYMDYPITSSEDWYTLPAGSTLNVHYSCYAWTPPPWSNNANANVPTHEAWSRSAKLRLWSFPMGDEDVR